MLISNESIIDLKILSETEVSHVFSNLKCAPGRAMGRGAQERRLWPSRSQRPKGSTKQKLPVSFGSPLSQSPSSLYSSSKASPQFIFGRICS